MTPCEEKGYEVGQVFKVLHTNTFAKGALVVLSQDDGSNSPLFDYISGGINDFCSGVKTKKGAYTSLRTVTRIYPPEEQEKPETITLMGKEYVKSDIENALADVLPVK